MAVVEYKMPPPDSPLGQQHYKETQGEIGCHRKALVVGPDGVAGGDVAAVEPEDDVVAVDDFGVGRDH